MRRWRLVALLILACVPHAWAACTFSSSNLTVIGQSCSTQSNGFLYGLEVTTPSGGNSGSASFVLPSSVSVSHIGISYRTRPSCDLVLVGFTDTTTGANVQPALILQGEQKSTQQWGVSESTNGVKVTVSATSACNFEIQEFGWR
jgi:hypothetical protein